MAMKKGALGRGLDSILIDNDSASSKDSISVVRTLDVEPNINQPRKNFDDEQMAALADSVATYGILQPITVRQNGKMYEIVAGERRWRAARMAGLNEIPVIIIDADDQRSAELALVENIQRSDLNPIEEAKAYSVLMENYGFTQEDVSKKIGKSRPAVANSLRLLDLPDAVQALLATGKISAGHAKVLLGIKDRVALSDAAKQVADRNLSVRDTEKLVKDANTVKKPSVQKPKHAVDYTRQLERSIESRLGRTVKIVENGEKSTLNIGFTDNADLEKLLTVLCGDEFVMSIK
ncbi:MAG: ParB/RepB/Spo0J family partition protein [Clostridia bacterium]|nr:ParB/RepB/Spo0J family partition protein [Clostridia bacterium]